MATTVADKYRSQPDRTPACTSGKPIFVARTRRSPFAMLAMTTSTTTSTATSTATTDAAPDRTLLRHLLATLAYRAGKALRDAPPDFADFRSQSTVRSPVEILTHMGDLFEWALSMALGKTVWRDSTPLPWPDEVSRFFSALTAFDTCLAGSAPLSRELIETLVQGPAADALTHTGQLALLRRMAGAAIRGESYARAEIVAGRTGMEQTAARVEFG
jgi:hypothetical protein